MIFFSFSFLITFLGVATIYGKTYQQLKKSFLSLVNCRDRILFDKWQNELINELRLFNLDDIDHSDFEVPDLVIILSGLQSEGRHSGKVKTYLNEMNKGHDGLYELKIIYSIITTVSMQPANYLDALGDLAFGYFDVLDPLFNCFSFLHNRYLENWSNFYQAVLIRFNFFLDQLLSNMEDHEILIRLSKYPNEHFISYILNLFSEKKYHVDTFLSVIVFGHDLHSLFQFYSGIDVDYITRSFVIKKDADLIRAMKVFERCIFNGIDRVFTKQLSPFVNVKTILL